MSRVLPCGHQAFDSADRRVKYCTLAPGHKGAHGAGDFRWNPGYAMSRDPLFREWLKTDGGREWREARWGDPTLSAEAVREELAESGIGARSGQVGGDHYAKHKIQPWDIWEEYGLNAFEGAVLKYLLRRKVDRLEDLKKARHTLDRLIEIEEQRGAE